MGVCGTATSSGGGGSNNTSGSTRLLSIPSFSDVCVASVSGAASDAETDVSAATSGCSADVSGNDGSATSCLVSTGGVSSSILIVASSVTTEAKPRVSIRVNSKHYGFHQNFLSRLTRIRTRTCVLTKRFTRWRYYLHFQLNSYAQSCFGSHLLCQTVGTCTCTT